MSPEELVRCIDFRYIIACNTASTITLPALRERFSCPIVGVVPAIKPAAKLTRNGVVGLLATRATVQRSYTHDLIAHFAKDCSIKMLGSAELVELAEAKLHGEEIDHAALKKILRPWLSMAEPPDTVVLGCTHFPLLREELAAMKNTSSSASMMVSPRGVIGRSRRKIAATRVSTFGMAREGAGVRIGESG